MSKYRICCVGDTHGDFEALEDLLEKVYLKGPLDTVCVVGDFGFYPRKKDWIHKLQDLLRITNRWQDTRFEFIDGNHDDHLCLNDERLVQDFTRFTGWHFRKRGEFDAEHGILYMGGSDSAWFDMISRLVTICKHSDKAAYHLLEKVKTWSGNTSIKIALKPRSIGYGEPDIADLLPTNQVARAGNEIQIWLHNFFAKKPKACFDLVRGLLLEVEKITGFRHWSVGEQLTAQDVQRGINQIKGVPYKLAISHTSPQRLVMDEHTLGKTEAGDHEPTRHLLDELLQFNQPDEWVFGHWHSAGKFAFDDIKTRFTLLDTISNDINQCNRLLPDGLARYNDFHRIIEL